MEIVRWAFCLSFGYTFVHVRVIFSSHYRAACYPFVQSCKSNLINENISGHAPNQKAEAMLVLGEVAVPTEGVRMIQDQVVAYAGEDAINGEGTLTVAESAVTWVSRRDGRGFSLSYPSIIMHAVSTDVSSFPHEHVLVIVDADKAGSRAPRRPIPLYTEEEAAAAEDVRLAAQELATGEGAEGDGDSDDGSNLLIRFVPSDMGALDTIYTQMAECQELNPEEEDMEEDEDEEEGEGGDDGGMIEYAASGPLGPGWFTADNLDAVELSEEGRANLERMMRNAERHNGGGDTNGHHDEEEEHGMEE